MDNSSHVATSMDSTIDLEASKTLLQNFPANTPPATDPACDPPFQELFFPTLLTTNKCLGPLLPSLLVVSPIIHINHNFVEKNCISTTLIVDFPTPLAERNLEDGNGEEPDNFPPLSLRYTSSEWSDESLIPKPLTRSDYKKNQLLPLTT